MSGSPSTSSGLFVADLKTIFDGYTLAYNRFWAETRKENPGPPGDAFHPLFEALNWAIALSDRLDEEWPGTSSNHYWYEDFPDSPHGPTPETMRGIRFVRNRIHHSWAEALEAVPRVPRKGHWDQRTHEWRWRPTADLPGAGAGTREGEQEYSRLLAGEPVSSALGQLMGLFGLAMQELPSGVKSPVYNNARAGSRWTLGGRRRL